MKIGDHDIHLSNGQQAGLILIGSGLLLSIVPSLAHPQDMLDVSRMYASLPPDALNPVRDAMHAVQQIPVVGNELAQGGLLNAAIAGGILLKGPALVETIARALESRAGNDAAQKWRNIGGKLVQGSALLITAGPMVPDAAEGAAMLLNRVGVLKDLASSILAHAGGGEMQHVHHASELPGAAGAVVTVLGAHLGCIISALASSAEVAIGGENKKALQDLLDRIGHKAGDAAGKVQRAVAPETPADRRLWALRTVRMRLPEEKWPLVGRHTAALMEGSPFPERDARRMRILPSHEYRDLLREVLQRKGVLIQEGLPLGFEDSERILAKLPTPVLERLIAEDVTAFEVGKTRGRDAAELIVAQYQPKSTTVTQDAVCGAILSWLDANGLALKAGEELAR